MAQQSPFDAATVQSVLQLVPLHSLTPAPWNPRLIQDGRFQRLCRSLQADPEFLVQRPILATADRVIYAGNMRWRAAEHLGWAVVPAVVADVPERLAKERALHDNNHAGEWQEDALAELLVELQAAGSSLDGLGFPDEQLNRLLDSVGALGDTLPPSELDAPPPVAADFVWPSDNAWGVPRLDPALQADGVVAPATVWGAIPRTRRMAGTWLFYTEDYRFEALWADPAPVLGTRAQAAVEPNFSCYADMPPAVALWAIYRKRWMARFWQQHGLRVFVDLNVAEAHAELNLLGVPRGWRAWATRGYAARLDATAREYARAVAHADGAAVLFLVYGGGAAVRDRCRADGWLWLPERADGVAGRPLAAGVA